LTVTREPGIGTANNGLLPFRHDRPLVHYAYARGTGHYSGCHALSYFSVLAPLVHRTEKAFSYEQLGMWDSCCWGRHQHWSLFQVPNLVCRFFE